MTGPFRWVPEEQQVAEIDRILAGGELILRVVRQFDPIPENNYATVIFVDPSGVQHFREFGVAGGQYAQKLMMDSFK